MAHRFSDDIINAFKSYHRKYDINGSWHYQVIKRHLQFDGASRGIWAIWSGAMWLQIMCHVAQLCICVVAASKLYSNSAWT